MERETVLSSSHFAQGEGDNKNQDSAGPSVIRGWQFLRHELLYLTWVMMEVAIITPLILAFTPWSQFWPPFIVAFWLLLLTLLPFNISRVSSVFRIKVERQQLVMIAALVTCLLIAWRNLLYKSEHLFDLGWLGELFSQIGQSGDPGWSRLITVFLLIVFVWWRGLSLVGRAIDIDQIGFRLRAGILLLVLFVAVIAGSQLFWSVTPFILLYFFSALLAVVLTRVEQLELGTRGISFPLGPRWLAFVTLAAATIAFITGLLSGFVSGEALTEVLGYFAPLWLALRYLAVSVAITVGYLLSPILIVLIWLVSLIFRLFQPIAEQVGLTDLQLEAPPTFEGAEAEELTPFQPTLFEFPQQLLPILIMLFLILLVTLALSRLLRLIRHSTIMETEPVHPFSTLGRPGLPGRGLNILDKIGILRRWRAAATVRHIYRQMSRKAAEAGFARPLSDTPYEYLPLLFEAWPTYVDEIKSITEAYVRVHYGEIPETQQELEELQEAWIKIRQTDPENTAEPSTDVEEKRRTRR